MTSRKFCIKPLNFIQSALALKNTLFWFQILSPEFNRSKDILQQRGILQNKKSVKNENPGPALAQLLEGAAASPSASVPSAYCSL
jgi:hypothetical protein